VAYRWRFNDGTEETTTGDVAAGTGEQIMVFSGVADCHRCQLTRHDFMTRTRLCPSARSDVLHRYDRQIPQPELRPAIDLAVSALMKVFNSRCEDDYAGRGRIGYPRALRSDPLRR
jgi:hypothetical protein